LKVGEYNNDASDFKDLTKDDGEKKRGEGKPKEKTGTKRKTLADRGSRGAGHLDC